MNCPHCHENLPADYGSPGCPYCGKTLATAPDATPLEPEKFNWRLFVGALLGAPLLTLISAALMRFVLLPQSTNEGVTPWIAMIGSVIGGIVCGVTAARRYSRDPGIRIVLSLVLSFLMFVVCIILCLFGCGFGGYNLRIGG